ncbi:MAG: hypothetical protein RLY20_2809 [Verrucomicrobiota bacterium]|jgi:uncharacterized metal-binding protein YceD (DUF177 family)
MPLTVNIQHLLQHSLRLKGDLPVEELELEVNDEMVQAKQPLRYDLEVEKLENAILARGRLRLKLDCQCVRCLKSLKLEVDLDGWACHLPLDGEDAVPIVNDSVDLTLSIREDILLGFPQHPVCIPECGGLKSVKAPKPGKVDAAKRGLPSSVLAELDKLKL